MRSKHHYPAGDMTIAGAYLSVAHKIARSIAPDHPCIVSIQKELFEATELAETYGQIWHSIVWIKSSTRTKKRIAETLNRIAFRINEHLENAIESFNAFCDSRQGKIEDGTLLFERFRQLKIRLSDAKENLERYHGREISSCQLPLFEKF
jgi:hypothetical protein